MRLADHSFMSGASITSNKKQLENYRNLLYSSNAYDHDLRQELCGVACVHPNPWVRVSTLNFLAPYHEFEDVLEAILWLTHDPEDFIIFRTAVLCGLHRIIDAVPELMMLVGFPSERLDWKNGKPVGFGHIVVVDAITKILGTEELTLLRSLEQLHAPEKKEVDVPKLEPSNAIPQSYSNSQIDFKASIKIPRGVVTSGLPEGLEALTLQFDWDDVRNHTYSVDVPEFFIDRFPVTCKEYDAFAASDAAFDSAFRHPSEPSNKIRVRNTRLDKRFGSNHPAVGVDWFDAYAYARYVGKRLPTEWEWQRAAQGDDKRVYPWGNSFDDGQCVWIGKISGTPVDTVEEWRQQLRELYLNIDRISKITSPVKDSGNQSPFGVEGMSGNSWEWTASNSLTGQLLEPDVGEKDLVDVTGDWRSFPVIKGGTWSSLPEELSVVFRGRDLLTDRHFENGFRCAATGEN